MSEKYPSVEEKVSYGVGRQMGEQLSASAFEGMALNAVLDGITSIFNGEDSAIDEKTQTEAYREIAARVQAKKAEEARALAAVGEEFLADNAKRDEVTVTESGLQYEVLTVGEGDTPTDKSTVRTHYRGTLVSGEVFDSSYDRGQPAEFPVSGVIPGWIEALQMMPVGSKWRLYVPHQLGYGEKGAGQAIGPYAALIFDVELIEIVS
jgi:FKBP-type peptidyl-prolyl cis-trans isomerase FklB